MKLSVSTPSRLHFGLFAVGDEVERSFGGVGLMVAALGTEITASPADRFQVTEKTENIGQRETDNSERTETVRKITQMWFERFHSDLGGDFSFKLEAIEDLPVHLKIQKATPRHSGLGSGTQLAMAIGIALQRYFGLPMPKPDELAVGLGRAARSAIGTYGCFEGGLIVDRGKNPDEQVSPIDLRVNFPEHWPIAIVRVNEPRSKQDPSPAGLHGAAEKDAFDRLPPTNEKQLAHMRSLVSQQLVPGVLEENYQRFAGALYEFGRRSGEYFAEIQGGPYASETISAVIETVYNSDVHATGQTSWGPSVFVVGQSWEHLQPAIANLKKRFGSDCHIDITRADNCGVVVTQNTPTSA